MTLQDLVYSFALQGDVEDNKSQHIKVAVALLLIQYLHDYLYYYISPGLTPVAEIFRTKTYPTMRSLYLTVRHLQAARHSLGSVRFLRRCWSLA